MAIVGITEFHILTETSFFPHKDIEITGYANQAVAAGFYD